MTTLHDFAELARSEQGLAVVSTLRADRSIQSSVVNIAVMPHPVEGDGDGDDIVAFVTYGKVKLGNLRVRPRLSVAVRSGWNWATAEGTAEIIGPDDPHPGYDADGIRLLLREIFVAAGGSHDDWDEYDRTMIADRRAAVLVRPARVYGNA
ncbi:TIGR03618 family F420-dependent PPOX class oxidoreductase [Streptomyces sp. NBC_01190]|uniref:TIGR03618 family F420-dependent PPOX class oxidoreductase n=1 Tax=Streptomyces sp. NBC_01190 TaxID=2903767 RepID=UPI00386D6C9B|nr:TIGR03618 family F420-dependent PPOX class oxidoreductase [Streptomyces sp. NBC_01190]